MTNDVVQFTERDAVGYLTLNNPDNMNALNPEMGEAMLGGLTALVDDVAVRAIVINGAGRAFMAGGDIRFFNKMLQSPDMSPPLPNLFESVHEFIRVLRSTGKPVLASVHGAVAGFGLSLVSACDMALAARSTVFTLAYCHLGVSPDGGSTWSLPRRVGLKNAFELALLGDRLDTEKAADMGLVNRVVDDDDLAQATHELAQRLAAGPSQALARAKALLNASFDNTLATQLKLEESAFLASIETDEFKEGVQAFLDKRSPRFSG